MDASRYSVRLKLAAAGGLCFALLGGCAGIEGIGGSDDGRFEFALIGDQQYNKESQAKFPNIMNDLNQADLAFVVHIGDFKGGMSPCTDDTFKSRKNDFDASKNPLIYTPGDNEWVDCWRAKKGALDPVERLGKLRNLFFQGSQSLGQRKLTLTRQSENPKYGNFRENARWTYEGVLFVTIHMPGENNNLGRTPEADAEYEERNAANLAWLKDAFDVAKRNGSSAIALFNHANPHFENSFPARRVRILGVAQSKKASGYSDFIAALEAETLAYDKPVVLMHGDTHYFRVDQPLFTNKDAVNKFGRQIENFIRVETFGFPEAHWVRVIVDSKEHNVFTFKPEKVQKNVVKHSK
jgi:hypothetical protein